MKKRLFTLLTASLLGQTLYAGCEKELFTINTDRGLTVREVLDQLSSQCQFTVVIKDEEAKAKLDDPIERLAINNFTMPEILSLLLTDNGIDYTLQNNILKVSYLTTKTFKVDYIATEREGNSDTLIQLSGGTQLGANGQVMMQQQLTQGGSQSSKTQSTNSTRSGTTTKSSDKFEFWTKLDKDLLNILNTPEDSYKAPSPVINKDAGLVTVTGTKQQVKRVQEYLEQNINRLHKQVLIDVQLYNVNLNHASQTGIDWSQIQNLQNFSAGYNKLVTRNVDTYSGNTITKALYGREIQDLMTTSSSTSTTSGVTTDSSSQSRTGTGMYVPANSVASLLNLSHSITINNLIAFLKTQGDVTSMSNPKVMTLDNQPAMISSGDQIFYKIVNTSILAGGTTGTSTTSETIESVFAGVLLDITPQIADDDTIVLKINPSITSCKETGCGSATDSSGIRLMPPDLQRKQLSAVIKVKDNDRLVMGGLISTSYGMTGTKLPLLGDIPGLGYLFKQDSKTKITSELVIVITPHIINPDKKPTLKDLGYSDAVIQSQSAQ